MKAIRLSPHRRSLSAMPIDLFQQFGKALRVLAGTLPKRAKKRRDALLSIADALCAGHWPFKPCKYDDDNSKAECFGPTVIQKTCPGLALGTAHKVSGDVKRAFFELKSILLTPTEPLMQPPKDDSAESLLVHLLAIDGTRFDRRYVVATIIVLRTLVARSYGAKSMGNAHRTWFSADNVISDHVINLGQHSRTKHQTISDALNALAKLAPDANDTPAGVLALAVGRLGLAVTEPQSFARALVDLQLLGLLTNALEIGELRRFGRAIVASVESNPAIEDEWAAIEACVTSVARGIVPEPDTYALPSPQRVRSATRLNVVTRRIAYIAESLRHEANFESRDAADEDSPFAVRDELASIDVDISEVRKLRPESAALLQAECDAVRLILDLEEESGNWWTDATYEDAVSMYSSLCELEASQALLDVLWSALLIAHPQAEASALHAS